MQRRCCHGGRRTWPPASCWPHVWLGAPAAWQGLPSADDMHVVPPQPKPMTLWPGTVERREPADACLLLTVNC